MILYLVRHGRTAGAEGRCVGHCDLPMDPAAAEGLRTLAATLPRGLSAATSDLARARTTADHLIGENTPRTVDPRLREMDFGEWDGRSWAELESTDEDRLRAWMAGWVETPAPGGECFADVARRVNDWWEEHGESGRDRLVVAHAGSLRALLCTLLDWPLRHAFRLQVDHGRISAVQLGREPVLRFLNADRVPG